MSGDKAGDVSAAWPCLIVDEVEQELRFLESAFKAAAFENRKGQKGELAHAKARIGNNVIVLEERLDAGSQAGCELWVWTDDLEATYRAALEAGATGLKSPSNREDGTRGAAVRARAGITWQLMCEVRKPSTKDVERRLHRQRKARL